MRIIHIMKDGTVRDSVKGTVIRDERFYQVLHTIMKRRSK